MSKTPEQPVKFPEIELPGELFRAVVRTLSLLFLWTRAMARSPVLLVPQNMVELTRYFPAVMMVNRSCCWLGRRLLRCRSRWFPR